MHQSQQEIGQPQARPLPPQDNGEGQNKEANGLPPLQGRFLGLDGRGVSEKDQAEIEARVFAARQQGHSIRSIHKELASIGFTATLEAFSTRLKAASVWTNGDRVRAMLTRLLNGERAEGRTASNRFAVNSAIEELLARGFTVGPIQQELAVLGFAVPPSLLAGRIEWAKAAKSPLDVFESLLGAPVLAGGAVDCQAASGRAAELIAAGVTLPAVHEELLAQGYPASFWVLRARAKAGQPLWPAEGAKAAPSAAPAGLAETLATPPSSPTPNTTPTPTPASTPEPESAPEAQAGASATAQAPEATDAPAVPEPASQAAAEPAEPVAEVETPARKLRRLQAEREAALTRKQKALEMMNEDYSAEGSTAEKRDAIDARIKVAREAGLSDHEVYALLFARGYPHGAFTFTHLLAHRGSAWKSDQEEQARLEGKTKAIGERLAAGAGSGPAARTPLALACHELRQVIEATGKTGGSRAGVVGRVANALELGLNPEAAFEILRARHYPHSYDEFCAGVEAGGNLWPTVPGKMAVTTTPGGGIKYGISRALLASRFAKIDASGGSTASRKAAEEAVEAAIAAGHRRSIIFEALQARGYSIRKERFMLFTGELRGIWGDRVGAVNPDLAKQLRHQAWNDLTPARGDPLAALVELDGRGRTEAEEKTIDAIIALAREGGATYTRIHDALGKIGYANSMAELSARWGARQSAWDPQATPKRAPTFSRAVTRLLRLAGTAQSDSDLQAINALALEARSEGVSIHALKAAYDGANPRGGTISKLCLDRGWMFDSRQVTRMLGALNRIRGLNCSGEHEASRELVDIACSDARLGGATLLTIHGALQAKRYPLGYFQMRENLALRGSVWPQGELVPADGEAADHPALSEAKAEAAIEAGGAGLSEAGAEPAALAEPEAQTPPTPEPAQGALPAATELPAPVAAPAPAPIRAPQAAAGGGATVAGALQAAAAMLAAAEQAGLQIPASELLALIAKTAGGSAT